MINVGIVGATGAVGQEFLKIFIQRNFPIKNLKVFSRSIGKQIDWNGKKLIIEEIKPGSFNGLDIVFFSAGGEVSKQYVPQAVKEGAIVIDNTNAFRMDKDVPLIVPEVNGDKFEYPRKIIANPNCSTAQLVVVLSPLHKAASLKRVVVSTYQSVSGAGGKAIEELLNETKNVLNGKQPSCNKFAHPIPFEVIPHIDVFDEMDYTKEEMKIIRESRKILNIPDLKITATAVRVPVIKAHSESVNIEFDKPISPDEVREVLSKALGVKVIDNPAEKLYPLARIAAGKDESFVGRIRKDSSVENGINMWIVSDNIRKGAALNAVQIAEKII